MPLVMKTVSLVTLIKEFALMIMD
jgi:hypothetical protein